MKTILICLFMVFGFPQVIFANADFRLPPSITTQGPTFERIFRQDDDVELECIGFGIPAVTYTWIKNEVELSPNSPRVKFGPNGGIKLENVDAQDEGYYRCVVSNMYGKESSKTYFLRRAVSDNSGISKQVSAVETTEGQPFYISNIPIKCFPSPTFAWDLATSTFDNAPTSVITDKRIQIDERGYLYFAYATKADGQDTKIYKSTFYNPYTDVKTSGGYTKIVVKPGALQPFSAVSAFSTKSPLIVVERRNMTLECFFSGNPVPDVFWTRPRTSIGRYKLNNYNTKLQIVDISAGDEGDYICNGQNTQSPAAEIRIQVVVQAAPEFRSPNDGPRNVNVTEGEDYTFYCNAYAKPDANIHWIMDGSELNINNLPARMSITHDKKSLTIKRLCKDCADGRTSDLMVIQCNASNVHGYALGSGYLNVLTSSVSSFNMKKIPLTVSLLLHFGLSFWRV